MNLFYSENQLYAQYVKEYLHTDNEQYYDLLKKTAVSMEQRTEYLIETSPSDECWQYEALRNMYLQHKQTADELLKSYQEITSEYESYYDQFLREDQLIADTMQEYYPLLTISIQTHLSELKIITIGSIIISMIDFICILIWLLYYSKQLTTFFARPLELITQNIRKFQKSDYSLIQATSSEKEIMEITSALNIMAAAVEQNMVIEKEKNELEKKLLISENEILKKDERLAASELKMLQNQINPHFLFNTLNMIYRMAIKSNASNVAEMILQTSNLLRYSLENQNKASNFKKEIDAIINYVEIQKNRLQDKVHFEIQLDNVEEILCSPIPGMILQPLVENALKHGLKDCLSGGIVEIRIINQKKLVSIIVNDNGKGISSKEVELLIMNDFHIHGLGLYNVVHRMKAFYRDSFQMEINSDVNCGFCIKMSINFNKFQINSKQRRPTIICCEV